VSKALLLNGGIHNSTVQCVMERKVLVKERLGALGQVLLCLFNW